MTAVPPCNLPADQKVQTHQELALALGGDDTSFTGDLLRLIAKADVGNRALLRSAFPYHVAAWELWSTLSGTLTAGELTELAAEVAAVSKTVIIDVDPDKL